MFQELLRLIAELRPQPPPAPAMKRSIAIHQQPTGGVRPNARQNDQINSSTTIPTTRPQRVYLAGRSEKRKNSTQLWSIPVHAF
jgi:hypothetical protein